MVVFGQSGCIPVKVVVFGKVVVLGQNWLYSGEIDVFGQSGGIRAKVYVFEQKWLYTGKVIVIG